MKPMKLYAWMLRSFQAAFVNTGKSVTVVLLITVILAFLVRAYTITWGLPYVYMEDEPVTTGRVLEMVNNWDLSPHFFHHPAVNFYIQVPATQIARVIAKAYGTYRGTPLSWIEFRYIQYLLGRFTVVCFSTATIFALFLAVRQMFDTLSGLAASSMLSVSMLHVEESRLIRPDIPAVFFATLFLLFTAKALDSNNRRYYLFAGALAGLAAATKYNAGMILIMVLVAFVITNWQRHACKVIFTRTFVLIPATAFLAFVAAFPSFILEFKTVIFDGILYEFHHYQLQEYSVPHNNWLYFPMSLFLLDLGPVISILVMIGLLYGLHRRTKQDYVLFSFVVPYYILITSQTLSYRRNLLYLFPFLLALAGRALVAFHKKVMAWLEQRSQFNSLQAYSELLLIGMTIVLMAWPMTEVVKYSLYITQKDTRTRTFEWIQNYIPPGSKFAVASVDSPELALDQNYITEYFYHLHEHQLGWYQQHGFNFIIATASRYSSIISQADKFPQEAAFYTQLFSCDLKSEFTPDEHTPGPGVRVYDISDCKNPPLR